MLTWKEIILIPNYLPSLNFDLGSTVDTLRDSIANFTTKEIKPLAEEIDKKNDFPMVMLQ